jgi:hypothetical protein
METDSCEYSYVLPAIAQLANYLGYVQLYRICYKLTNQTRQHMHYIAQLTSCLFQSVNKVDCVTFNITKLTYPTLHKCTQCELFSVYCVEYNIIRIFKSYN